MSSQFLRFSLKIQQQSTIRLLPVLFGFSVMLGSCQQKTAEVTAESSEIINSSTSPLSLQFQDLKGATVAFAPKEKKWTVLHFWATWCKPCLAEFPELKKVLPQLQNDSTQFLIASDEDLDRIDAFEKRYETGLELIRLTEGSMADFEIYALPTTLVFDGEGKEVFRKAGQLDWKSVGSIQELITNNP
jgi:thiol-disulfide isomerase/thioredoxin